MSSLRISRTFLLWANCACGLLWIIMWASDVMGKHTAVFTTTVEWWKPGMDLLMGNPKGILCQKHTKWKKLWERDSCGFQPRPARLHLILAKRQNCFGFMGLISAMLMLGWGRSHRVTPNDPTLVVLSKSFFFKFFLFKKHILITYIVLTLLKIQSLILTLLTIRRLILTLLTIQYNTIQ